MVPSLERWVGKVGVVTGAASGIGAGISEFLVDKGLIVVGVDRRYELVEELAKKLTGRKGQLHAVKADVSNEEDVVKAFKWVEDNVGHVHILINNAGVAAENFLYNGDVAQWKATLDVNVLGVCIVTREAVKNMMGNNINGHVIHINSVAGHKIPNWVGINIYTASKHAVTALAETLRQEFNHLGSKIKITSLSPGLVATEMTTLNSGFSEERKAMLKSMPILQPQDIAEAVGYVLSTPENVQIQELTIVPLGETF